MYSVEDFKDYFQREFVYLPVYVNGSTYKKDDVVYYTDKLFYISLENNNTALPTDTEKWNVIDKNYFDYINDNDILKAMGQATGIFNSSLFEEDIRKICYLLLTAHFLVIDLSMAKGNGASSFIINSKSVDGVSASYSIPQTLLNSPYYSYLAKTEFGLKYLQFLSTRLNGYNRIVRGATSYL